MYACDRITGQLLCIIGLLTQSCPEVYRKRVFSSPERKQRHKARMRATRAVASPGSATCTSPRQPDLRRLLKAVWGREVAWKRRVRTTRSPVGAAAIRRQVEGSQRTLRGCPAPTACCTAADVDCQVCPA